MKDRFVASSDVEIIARIIGGETDAFELLIERHRGRVFDIVSRHVPQQDAETVAHEAFVRIYLSLRSFEGSGDFGGWLSKIATRACYDYWRGRYRRRECEESALSDEERRWLEEAAAERSAAALERSDSAGHADALLERVLSRLSPEDRMVIELVHIDELPVKAAAAMLGWSVANVKVRAFRARKKLRGLLEQMIEERKGRR